MTRAWHGPVRWVGFLVRAGVALTCVLAVAAAVLLHVGPSSHPLLILAPYLPWPWLLLPAVLSLWCTIWLRPVWRWMAALSVVLVAVVVMDLAWGSPDDGERPLRVMTYNAKVLLASQRPGGMEGLASEIAFHDPDVLVMQDAGGLPAMERSTPGLLNSLFGDRQVFFHGQYVVASRYPMSGCRAVRLPFPVEYHERHDFVHCEVQGPNGPFTLVTVHFVTPRQGLLAVRHGGLDGLEAWEGNVMARIEQAHGVAEHLRGVAGPVIVAGDLNAPERSEVVRSLLATGLRDVWSSAGRGYGYTHGHSLRIGLHQSFLRIDHILVSSDIGVQATEVGGALASEHRPVIADLLMQRRR